MTNLSSLSGCAIAVFYDVASLHQLIASPITTAFEEYTKMNVCLLPVGACDDMAHSQNEKYNKRNLINGVKVLGLYLHELGKLEGPKPSSCRCVELTSEELMEPGAFLRGFKCKCVM